MVRHEWYRNTDWTTRIEATFREKLSRARSQRPQYLEIQARYLTSGHPLVALQLIDEYFETGDEFFVPGAYCTRAAAYRALGMIEQAVAAYKQALDWEEARPGFITDARIALPKVVAEHRLSEEYDYALNVLTTRFTSSDHQFPVTRYEWNGCCALIASERGQASEAREFAARALRAAGRTQSPFRYHKDVGVVRDTSDEFGRRITRIAQPSGLRSLLRFVTPD